MSLPEAEAASALRLELPLPGFSEVAGFLAIQNALFLKQDFTMCPWVVQNLLC